MTDLTLSRRRFVALGGAGALAMVPLPGFALTIGQAERLVNSAVTDINAVIRSGAPVETMIRSFKTIFDDYSDTSYVAAYALGNDGRTATDAQKSAFADAFSTYLANKYGRRFNEFSGGEIQLQGSQEVNSFVEVRALAVLRNQAPFQVDFHVSDRPGRPVFFNLIVEGINMLLSERAEIGAMLDARGGDMDAMIRDLN